MRDKKYTISDAKANALFAAVDAPIMDARIKITRILNGVCNQRVSDQVYDILRQLNMKAPQAAIDEFLKSKK